MESFATIVRSINGTAGDLSNCCGQVDRLCQLLIFMSVKHLIFIEIYRKLIRIITAINREAFFDNPQEMASHLLAAEKSTENFY